MTYGELYRRGRDALEAAGVPEAELDARLLLEWVCGTDRSDLLAHGDTEFTVLHWLDVYGWRYVVGLLGNFNC